MKPSILDRRVVPAFDPLQAGTLHRCGICGGTVVPDPVEWRLLKGACDPGSDRAPFVCESCADRWHQDEWEPLTLADALGMIPTIVGAGSAWIAAVADPEGPSGTLIRLAVNARTGIHIRARGRTWSKSKVPTHRATFELRRMLLELGGIDFSARAGCGNLPPWHPSIPRKTYDAVVQALTQICDQTARGEDERS